MREGTQHSKPKMIKVEISDSMRWTETINYLNRIGDYTCLAVIMSWKRIVDEYGPYVGSVSTNTAKKLCSYPLASEFLRAVRVGLENDLAKVRKVQSMNDKRILEDEVKRDMPSFSSLRRR